MRIAFDLTPAAYKTKRDARVSKLYIVQLMLIVLLLSAVIGGVGLGYWYVRRLKSSLSDLTAAEAIYFKRQDVLMKDLQELKTKFAVYQNALKIINESLPVDASMELLSAVVPAKVQLDQLRIDGKYLSLIGLVSNANALNELMAGLTKIGDYGDFRVLDRHTDDLGNIVFRIQGQRKGML